MRYSQKLGYKPSIRYRVTIFLCVSFLAKRKEHKWQGDCPWCALLGMPLWENEKQPRGLAQVSFPGFVEYGKTPHIFWR